MARNTTARRGFKQSSVKSNSASTTASKLPEPFKPVPVELQPLVSTLPTDHFYLVHIDRTPVSAKKQAFLVPVVLNVVILLGLCLRVYYAAPQYLGLVITVFKYDTSYAIDPSISSNKDIVSMIFSRTFLFLTDYALFWLIGSWPREFVAGSVVNRFVGPLGWKMDVGMQEEEVIVRRGRKWDTPILDGVDDSHRAWGIGEELSIKVKVEAAMRKIYTSKTGLSMLDKDWDLDYKAMVDAHRFIADGRANIKDLEDIALVYYHKQWLVWQVHEPRHADFDTTPDDTKVQKFKQTLTDLGCEDIFFRWIEMIQYETSQPGGFTEGRQADAMRELRRMMTDKGVDYARFWASINGQDGLPGFD